MPTYRHPKTGVELNSVKLRRAHLSPQEEDTARLLRAEGEDYHIIAAKFGINQGRISELLGPQSDGRKGTDDQASMEL